MEESNKPCKGLLDLNKANDWHLILGLSILKVLTDKKIITQEEVQAMITEATKDVIAAKFNLMQLINAEPDKTTPSSFIKAAFDA